MEHYPALLRFQTKHGLSTVTGHGPELSPGLQDSGHGPERLCLRLNNFFFRILLEELALRSHKAPLWPS